MCGTEGRNGPRVERPDVKCSEVRAGRQVSVRIPYLTCSDAHDNLYSTFSGEKKILLLLFSNGGSVHAPGFRQCRRIRRCTPWEPLERLSTLDSWYRIILHCGEGATSKMVCVQKPWGGPRTHLNPDPLSFTVRPLLGRASRATREFVCVRVRVDWTRV